MYKSIHFWNQKNQMNPMVATRGASLRLFCYPGNRFLIRSVNRVTVHNSEICKKGRKQK